jgi:hypothetical protein
MYSMYYNGEMILLSRAFLETCLNERMSQEDFFVLDSDQREFLELVARSATFSRDPIVVPKELLDAFLSQEVNLFTSRREKSDDLEGA